MRKAGFVIATGQMSFGEPVRHVGSICHYMVFWLRLQQIAMPTAAAYGQFFVVVVFVLINIISGVVSLVFVAFVSLII